MTSAEIRLFAETDRLELRALFTRAGDGAPPGSFWGHPEAEASVYLNPYMDLEPESLFVAVVDGALVGYLAGCVDSAAFPSESARIEDAIRKYRLLLRPRSIGFFGRAAVDATRAKLQKEPSSGDFDDPRWPSPLHINVVPEARGTGAGAALMEAWFNRLGFATYGPTPWVPGVRYRGKKLHQQTMVRTAAKPN